MVLNMTMRTDDENVRCHEADEGYVLQYEMTESATQTPITTELEDIVFMTANHSESFRAGSTRS